MTGLIEELLKQGLKCHKLARVDEAGKLYHKILAQDPQQTDALHLLGLIAQQLGQSENALDYIRRAVKLAPDFAQYRLNLGIVLQDMGNLEEAAKELEIAVGQSPDLPEAHYNLGNVYACLGADGDALKCFQYAVAIRPSYSDALSNIAHILRHRGEAELALAYLERAVKSPSPAAEAFSNLCAAYTDANRFNDALRAGKAAIEFQPNNGIAHYNLGNALTATEDIEAASDSFRRAVKLLPNYADAWSNLGASLLDLGDPEEAITAFDKAISLEERLPDANWNRALALLTLGRFREGWDAYEWRWKAVPWLDRHSFEQPQWDGEPLNGRTLLLHTEQGYGDTLLFLRYIEQLRDADGVLRLACQPALKRLLSMVADFKDVVGYGEPLGDFDLQLPIMSLPKVLGIETAACEDGVIPYLFAPPCEVPRILEETLPKIALVWRASRVNPRGLFRSCALEDLAPILTCKEAQFYSVQMDAEDGEKKLLDEWGVVDLSNEIEDFADTAAAIDQMDLVISVDTVLAHVGGALGIPVWTLLVRAADWRWFLDPHSSPWYPAMRLFRQSNRDEWNGPVNAVVGELPKFLDTIGQPGR
jgi:tetratricopeptide (TPR) repeat protein